MKMNKYNILWVFCDQLRSQALSCYGDPNIRTPNIDRLAAEGARFTNAYSQYPVCSPFRASLVTGQHAHIHEVRVLGDLLKTEKKTCAHTFREAGYRTSWVGKWHLGGMQNARGWTEGIDAWIHPYLRGGFEDWFGFENAATFYDTYYTTGELNWPQPKIEKYQTDGLTDLSLQYLSETAAGLGKPWFHCISVEAPHTGRDKDGSNGNPAPEEYVSMFHPDELVLRENVPARKERKNGTVFEEKDARKMLAGYYAQIANLDHNVGRILDWLDASGLSQNTLVAFFSDHGDMGGSHGMFHKQVIYDESIGIPLLMRLPGVIPPGTVVEQPVCGLDIYPTCAAFCGVPIPPEVQGYDYSGVLTGSGERLRSCALVQWLGQARYGFCNYEFRGIRTEQYTYCISPNREHCMLFDNRTDPFQMVNLYGSKENSVLQEKLHVMLCREIVRSGEKLPEFVLDVF